MTEDRATDTDSGPETATDGEVADDWETIRNQFKNRVVRLSPIDSAEAETNDDDPTTDESMSTGTTGRGNDGTEIEPRTRGDSGPENRDDPGSGTGFDSDSSWNRSPNPHTGAEMETEAGNPDSSAGTKDQTDERPATTTPDYATGRSTNEPSRIPSPPSVDLPSRRGEYEMEPIDVNRSDSKLTQVYRATHPDMDRPVVLKTENRSRTRPRHKVERITEEARTLRRFADTPHVVTLLSAGDSVDRPIIVMEYMDGGDLAGKVGDLPVEQALWTGICITHGVYSAHRRSVQHLDIKPSNVLFRSVKDAWDVPKVADWGESRTVTDDESTRAFSTWYAAPEQHLREQPGLLDQYDIEWSRFRGDATETDQYQLGIVLYELLTGEHPFDIDANEAQRAKFEQEPKPPSTVIDTLPPAIDEPLLRALQIKPRERYPDLSLLMRGLATAYDAVVDTEVSPRGIKYDDWTTRRS